MATTAASKTTPDTTAVTKTAIARQIEKLGPWFHNLHLPNGEQTAPHHFLGDFPSYKWQQISPHLPQDMSGMRALDIGCNAGYYSFELAKRGARVTAIDIDERYLKQARWAAETLDLADKIDFRRAAIYQLAAEKQQYDVVWFMGVMYHLRYPMLALDIVRRCCRGQMVFQTMTAPGDEVLEAETNYDLHEREIMSHPGWPKMAFIEHRVADDPTNWWAPNHACVQAMLRAAGFDNIRCIAHEIYTCETAAQISPAATEELNSVLRGIMG